MKEKFIRSKTILYASGSKFPSGGICTAGYCVGNDKTTSLMEEIDIHVQLCDNEATHHQMEILAEQWPSMDQRIADAYKNTREFVNFIQEKLPEAKINFVSEELANQSFTPSGFFFRFTNKRKYRCWKRNVQKSVEFKANQFNEYWNS